jgi:hypothetical protein
MRQIAFLIYFVISIVAWRQLEADSLPAMRRNTDKEWGNYIQALASLTFHTQTWDDQLERKQSNDTKDLMIFSEEEAAHLWMKVARYLNFSPKNDKINQQQARLKQARLDYDQAYDFLNQQNKHKALQAIVKASESLLQLWEEACEEENPSFLDFCRIGAYRPFLSKQLDPHLETNPYISKKIKRNIRPYLIPLGHPMRRNLERIFSSSRATTNEKTLKQAGFEIIAPQRPRSFIIVARHPLLSRYLVKLYLDNTLKQKSHKPSWQWLVLRCQGADKISRIIKDKRIKHFVVAKKWIYCLPPEPSPPQDDAHTRHLAILLVKDMNLVHNEVNLYAWSHSITTEHLEELYMIISRARGSSYRPDNINYTKQKKFAFIDTEYPSHGPDYKRIRPYLNREMRDYWDKLVKRGGF